MWVYVLLLVCEQPFFEGVRIMVWGGLVGCLWSFGGLFVEFRCVVCGVLVRCLWS